eukprot:11228328-Lingulodinium_polyedra.AAC.2
MPSCANLPKGHTQTRPTTGQTRPRYNIAVPTPYSCRYGWGGGAFESHTKAAHIHVSRLARLASLHANAGAGNEPVAAGPGARRRETQLRPWWRPHLHGARPSGRSATCFRQQLAWRYPMRRSMA